MILDWQTVYKKQQKTILVEDSFFTNNTVGLKSNIVKTVRLQGFFLPQERRQT